MNLWGLLKNDFFNQHQEILSSDWIEWQDEGIAVTHCAICQVLNGCWFRDDNKPQMPQHPNCHCKRLFIDTPVPNETGRATCDIRKFTEYLFSEKYTDNGKIQMFRMLGFDIADPENMKSEFEKQAAEKYCNGEYKLGLLNEYGQRISIEIDLTKNGRNIRLITGWMVRPKGLITCTTPLGG